MLTLAVTVGEIEQDKVASKQSHIGECDILAGHIYRTKCPLQSLLDPVVLVAQGRSDWSGTLCTLGWALWGGYPGLDGQEANGVLIQVWPEVLNY